MEQAIAALEAQRKTLGDQAADAALEPLREQLSSLGHSQEISRQVLMEDRKLATVMFADISGFTALLEELDPEAVQQLVFPFPCSWIAGRPGIAYSLIAAEMM